MISVRYHCSCAFPASQYAFNGERRNKWNVKVELTYIIERNENETLPLMDTLKNRLKKQDTQFWTF